MTTAEMIAAVQKAKASPEYNKQHDYYEVETRVKRMTDRQIRYAHFLAKHFNTKLDIVLAEFQNFCERHQKEEKDV